MTQSVSARDGAGFPDPSQVLNPLTPMAYMPPDLAFQSTLAGFIIACSLSVYIWDILHNLVEDYCLLFKRRIRYPTLIYFLSRIFTLGYLIGKNVQLNTQIDHCRTLEMVLCGLFVAGQAGTSFLFYIRVCAVYDMRATVMSFFGFTWIVLVAGATSTFATQEGVHIGPTRYCTSRIKNEYIIATQITALFNDILVFLAVLYRLTLLNMATGERIPQGGIITRVKRLAALHGFMKGFLQDSQIYYLIAVVMNFTTMITFFAVKNPPDSPFRVILIFPNTVVVNIMACRVFRNVQFGRLFASSLMTTEGHSTNPMEFVSNNGTDLYSATHYRMHRIIEEGRRTSCNGQIPLETLSRHPKEQDGITGDDEKEEIRGRRSSVKVLGLSIED